MSVMVSCPGCLSTFEIDEAYPSEDIKCPNCPATFPFRPRQERDNLSVSRRSPVRRALDGLRRGWLSASMITSGLLALILTIIFYTMILRLFPESSLADLFAGRGWVPYVIVILTLWSALQLVMKYFKQRRQATVLSLEILPGTAHEHITPDTASLLLRGLRENADRSPVLADNVLVQRLIGGLQHFRARRSVHEVVEHLNKQADADADTVEASYTTLKVIVWAIPILGFIGTVLGLGEAVGGFSESLQSAQLADGGHYVDALEGIKGSLGGVTDGLATAFDTTLIALVASLLIMFPSSSLQKSEESFLAKVESYCDESLIRRLDDQRPAEPPMPTLELIERAIAREVARVIAEDMAEHHALLRTEAEKLKNVGHSVSQKVLDGWQKILTLVSEQQEQQLGLLTQVLATGLDAQLDAAREIASASKSMEQALGVLAHRTELIERELADSINDSVASLTEAMEQLRNQAETTTETGLGAMAEATGRLDRSVSRLADQAKGIQLETAHILMSQLSRLVDGTEQSQRQAKDEVGSA